MGTKISSDSNTESKINNASDDKLLEELVKYQRRQVSYGHVFMRGIVGGLATAIGATIVFGIGLSFLARTINTLEISDVSIFQQIVNSADEQAP